MDSEDPDLREYRSNARAWLTGNLARRATGGRSPIVRSETRSAEDIARNRALQRVLFEGGYAGITFPKEYGGQGLTPAYERAFRAEAAEFVLPDLGGAGAMTMTAIAQSMLAHASPAFLRRHIPKMLSGEEVWCQFYSEPEAGSDLAGIRTTAKRDGDRWVINGSKIWTTGAYYSDWAMCLARTDWNVPKHQGLTWFVIPTDAAGVTIQKITQIDGNAGFCQEFLDDVIVTDDDMLGELGQGWTVAQTMLVYERGGGTPMAGLTASGRPELAPDLVALARAVDRTGDPLVRQLIARAHTIDVALSCLGERIRARLAGSDTPNPAVAGYAKLASGTFAPVRARIAAEIGGAAAVLWPGDEDTSDVAMNYLNGRMVAIASGTNEMQRNGIGERVLGLPREPSFDQAKPFAEVVRAAHTWNHRV
ncbi:acyl-CoA dehydrogenase family protein [Acrocarpospora macrocephala]|uniref:Acyl-CoA dehydrogenase n=1 Tax=Acrocarpospora macrocephala TaxID=150177 RepID=A0A5M3WRK2_9ACTN|nr:acyl-CoA dehydrogenase family protein [Acrocarpospora macrocephala]GES09373.1 acyl-CoA dehydrogenase [Acrocarpospora macrocephala]